MSNVALSVLDEHIARSPGGPATTNNERAKRRRQGLPNYRISRPQVSEVWDWRARVALRLADDLNVGLRVRVVGCGGTMPGGLRVRFDVVLVAGFRCRACGVAVAVG